LTAHGPHAAPTPLTVEHIGAARNRAPVDAGAAGARLAFVVWVNSIPRVASWCVGRVLPRTASVLSSIAEFFRDPIAAARGDQRRRRPRDVPHFPNGGYL
jgi:hypothetical protein